MLLEFEEYGKGHESKPDLVLIHGTGAQGRIWTPQINLLVDQGFRCVVPELRGHGRTPEPGVPTGIIEHVGDILETIDRAKVKLPAIFIGHSLGAIISLHIAQHNAEIVSKVLAVSIPGKVLSPVAVSFDLLLKTPYQKVGSTKIKDMLSMRHQMMLETDKYSLQQIVDNFARIDLVSEPKEPSCTVHLSVGSFDYIAPAHYVRKLHKALPQSTLRVFDWAGHNLMDDKPQEFNDWLLRSIFN
jgi:pimeloyl-ACP methyl ester carboxylesterase